MYFSLITKFKLSFVVVGALFIFNMGFKSQLHANPPAFDDCGSSDSGSQFLKTVGTFADNVLKNGRDQYGNTHSLELAEVIGINIIDEHFIKEYFVPSESYIYTCFDSPELLALFHLVAARNGKSHLVPANLTGIGETDGKKLLKKNFPTVGFMNVR